MSAAFDTLSLLLFVPADRPDRYAKAFGAGADATILDLEDAVAGDAKDAARSALVAAREAVAAAGCPVIVRINPAGTDHHEADLVLMGRLPAGLVMVPKVEAPETVARIAAATGRPVIALVESARGLAAARAIAGVGARLAFGSIDFAADLGCAHRRDALLAARSELVVASRLAGRPAPIDGVTTAIRDAAVVQDDAAYAAALGFAGKLLIHPAQVAPARAGFRPSVEEIDWAERVMAAGAAGGAASVDGAMVDAPVRLRARQIIRRAGAAADERLA